MSSRPVSRSWSQLFGPVDIAPLVYFRIVFGALMLWEVTRYFDYGWIGRYYIEPEFHFKYFGFEWVNPWPGFGMYSHFFIMGVLAAMIMLGFCYRAAAVLFFLGFTYVFLLDQANYLNHFYLISLVSFLMIFLPANRALSIDAGRRPAIRTSVVPAWTLWLLRLQLAVPYFYGGIAKINVDWLRGEPPREWLSRWADVPFLGSLMTQEWFVYMFCYGGLLFDLLIVPMLLWRRTRWLGVAWLLAFHLINSQLFHIGVFPWFMIFATPVLLPPTLIRRGLRALAIDVGGPDLKRSEAVSPDWRKRAIVGALVTYAAFQLLFPFRHLLYPGSPSWTEEGHNFAWHMKLRDKDAQGLFRIVDRESGETWYVEPREYLSSRQTRKMCNRPEMILQFAHFLAEKWRARGYRDVEVYAQVDASLNGRPFQPLVDPRVDLTRKSRTIIPADWIVPLRPTQQVSQSG